MQFLFDVIQPNSAEFPRVTAYFRHHESARTEMWEKKTLEPSPNEFSRMWPHYNISWRTSDKFHANHAI